MNRNRTLPALCFLLSFFVGLPARGQSWVDITANLPVAPKVGTGQSIASNGSDLFVLKSGNGVLRSSDSGATWTASDTVQGNPNDLTSFGTRSIDATGTTVWAGCEPGSLALTGGVLPLHRFTLPAATWTPSFAGAAVPPVVDAIAHDTATNTRWCAGRLGGIFKSTDGGTTWIQANGNLPGTNCASIIARNGTVIAAVTGNGMGAFTSTDGGATWRNRGVPLPQIGTLCHIGDQVVVIGTGDTSLTTGVYFSKDFGLSWQLTQVDTAGGLKLLSNTCADATTMFSGGTTVSISPTYQVSYNPTVAFSLNGGATWDDLTPAGLPTGFGKQVERLCRHGNRLFALTGDSRLYSLDLTTIALVPSLKIAVHPAASKSITGGTLTMEVSAGGPGTLAYQWKKDGTDVDGQNSATLRITNAQPADTGSYTCVVTAGGNQVTSNPAAGTVVDRVEGRYDPTYDRGNLGPGEGGTAFLRPDGSLLVLTAGGAYKIGPDGGKTDSRAIGGTTGYYARCVDSEGRILLGGIQGGGSTHRIRRLSGGTGFPDDTSFPQLSANGTIRGLVELPGHGYLVYGDFSTLGPVGGTQASVARIALINHDGSLNATFNNNALGSWGSGAINGGNVHVTSGGSIWVSSSSLVKKLTSSGTSDPGFTPYTASESGNLVSAVGMLSSGKLLVTLGNSGTNRRLRLINADGSFDDSFNTADARLNAPFISLAEQPDGKIIISGSFTSYGGNACAGYLRMSAGGVFDSSFYCTTGYGASSLAYDPRGYLFMGNENNSNAATFQDSGTMGDTIGKNFVRVFATPAPPQSPFAAWAAGYPFPPGQGEVDDDPDGDGYDNALELLYGGDPLSGISPGPSRAIPATGQASGSEINALAPGAGLDDAKTYRLVTVRVPKDSKGFTVGLQATVHFPDFDGSASAHEFGTPQDDGNHILRTYYLTPSSTGQAAMFWRVVATP